MAARGHLAASAQSGQGRPLAEQRRAIQPRQGFAARGQGRQGQARTPGGQGQGARRQGGGAIGIAGERHGARARPFPGRVEAGVQARRGG